MPKKYSTKLQNLETYFKMENLLEKDVQGSIGAQKYLCTISWRNGELLMDEPATIGGQDLGPDPYSTLLASLGVAHFLPCECTSTAKVGTFPKFRLR